MIDSTDESASAERPRFAMLDDRYELIERIGTGAMGVVFRGEDVELGRRVAIKLIEPTHAADPAFVAMFRAEARALARIRHENVVQVYSFGRRESSFYLAMEYVEGVDLETLIAKSEATGSPFDLDHAIGIIRRVALGLEAAHAQGLVHRDVKPSNILIEARTERPVLIDFGLADTSAFVTNECTTMGTPEYMAPEQVHGLAVTPRADVYALACTTFELLTGRPIFDDTDAMRLMTAHAARTPPSLSSLRPDLAELDDALLRALAKDPDQRHATATAFADDLERNARRVGRRAAPPLRIAPVAPAQRRVRVLVFERDEAIRRHLVSALGRVLRSAGDEMNIDCAGSALEFAQIADGDAPDIVIIDDESADGAISDVLDTIRADVPPEVLVLRESFEHLGRDGLRLRELPKPLNAQVLASVISRMAVAIAERWNQARPHDD